MPRKARLDAPGTLHHVIIRGIERRDIVDDDKYRKKNYGVNYGVKSWLVNKKREKEKG